MAVGVACRAERFHCTYMVIGSGVKGGVLALQAADSNIPSEVLYLLKSVRYARIPCLVYNVYHISCVFVQSLWPF